VDWELLVDLELDDPIDHHIEHLIWIIDIDDGGQLDTCWLVFWVGEQEGGVRIALPDQGLQLGNGSLHASGYVHPVLFFIHCPPPSRIAVKNSSVRRRAREAGLRLE
jgi:hypothetical protein